MNRLYSIVKTDPVSKMLHLNQRWTVLIMFIAIHHCQKPFDPLIQEAL